MSYKGHVWIAYDPHRRQIIGSLGHAPTEHDMCNRLREHDLPSYVVPQAVPESTTWMIEGLVRGPEQNRKE